MTDRPLELVTRFEPPNVQRAKMLRQLRWERQTFAPRYLNKILKLQRPSAK